MTARPSESLRRVPKVESNITLKFVNFSQNSRNGSSQMIPQIRGPPEAPKPYEYKALTVPYEIRYVQILAGTDNAPLCCKIVHHTLQNNELEYTALSYTWGDSEETFEVACESTSSGIYLKVTKNCYLAMKRLRDNDKSTSIWIDAICIDQSNIAERNFLVAIMDQIYAKATNTVVYLGEEENDSEIGMKIIRSLASNRSLEKMISSPRNKAALSKLLDRPWCNRIWVLQEVFVSNSISVVCGPSEVSWKAMTNLSKIMERYQGEFDWPYIPCVLSLRGGRHRDTKWNLWDLLCHTRQCASSDPRDKVFALASIVTDKKKYNLQPDYGMSIKSVFVDLATSFLDAGGLDFLLAVQFLPSELDLPSWVPDWTLRFGMGYINEINPLARAGGTHWRLKATVIHLQSLYDYDLPNADRLILKVRGMHLGEIKTVSDVQVLGGPGWRERLLGLSYVPKARDDEKIIEDQDSKYSAPPRPRCSCCPITQNGKWDLQIYSDSITNNSSN
jgi:hypothetical protein